MAAVVYLGRARLEISVLRSKSEMKIRDTLGFTVTNVSLADVFSNLTLDQLHQAMAPIFAAKQLEKERDRRQLVAVQRKRIKERDHHTCRYCGRKGDNRWDPDRKSWHIDHVIPVVKDGTNEDDNLVLACQGCNLAKSAKDPEEFEADAQWRSLHLLRGEAK